MVRPSPLHSTAVGISSSPGWMPIGATRTKQRVGRATGRCFAGCHRLPDDVPVLAQDDDSGVRGGVGSRHTKTSSWLRVFTLGVDGAVVMVDFVDPQAPCGIQEKMDATSEQTPPVPDCHRVVSFQYGSHM